MSTSMTTVFVFSFYTHIYMCICVQRNDLLYTSRSQCYIKRVALSTQRAQTSKLSHPGILEVVTGSPKGNRLSEFTFPNQLCYIVSTVYSVLSNCTLLPLECAFRRQRNPQRANQKTIVSYII